MSEWQPIETAPEDGTPFLVWSEEPILGSHVQVWSNRTPTMSGVIAGHFAFEYQHKTITKWQPLPAPPETPE